MQVQFNFPRGIDNKDYAAGTHEVPAALADHWYFQALQKCGDVEIIGEAPKAKKADAPRSMSKAVAFKEETISKDNEAETSDDESTSESLDSGQDAAETEEISVNQDGSSTEATESKTFNKSKNTQQKQKTNKGR